MPSLTGLGDQSQPKGRALLSAYKILDDFTDLNIQKEMTGFKRNRYFLFKEYLDQFHK